MSCLKNCLGFFFSRTFSIRFDVSQNNFRVFASGFYDLSVNNFLTQVFYFFVNLWQLFFGVSLVQFSKLNGSFDGIVKIFFINDGLAVFMEALGFMLKLCDTYGGLNFGYDKRISENLRAKEVKNQLFLHHSPI